MRWTFCGEKTALDQPANCALCRTFADADVFRQLSIPDLYLGASLFRFGSEPEVDKEAGWAAIVSGEVAHEDVDEVWIDLDHSYTSQYYSFTEAIALALSVALVCRARRKENDDDSRY
ncbi:hypothetical protein RBB78_11425 [Tunturiibacter empetritectus]|uniref:hypothetical protein n=1 Tax=Tunturiibacter empetritectus TaxID=3069691 RepID=UPI003D9AE4AD